MSNWHKYTDLEPVRRLRYEGRELLGKEILLTEKRDGENVSLWLEEGGEVHIASHNQQDADKDIQSRMKSTPEYPKAIELLKNEFIYNKRWVAYGELLKSISPTRIEPRRKNIHWILFDIYDLDEEKYLPYQQVFQQAYHFKIPVVRVVERFIPETMDEIFEKIEFAKKWCKRHRREGVVGKNYYHQLFFKEKADLPELPKIKKRQDTRPQYPPMPEEKILRALQHAFDEVGEENWKDKSIAMPIVARHIATEAREHNFDSPKNFYRYYVETPIEKLRGVSLTAQVTQDHPAPPIVGDVV